MTDGTSSLERELHRQNILPWPSRRMSGTIESCLEHSQLWSQTRAKSHVPMPPFQKQLLLAPVTYALGFTLISMSK